MPTLLKIGDARFFFFSNEGLEPPHVHVRASAAVAKFWLDPVSLAKWHRFKGHELRRLEALVRRNRRYFLEAWSDHFGT